MPRTSDEISSINHLGEDKDINSFAKSVFLEPAIQHWLRDVFQIVTVSDLAALPVDHVFCRLEEENKGILRSEVENWITQAKEFVAGATSWQTFATFIISFQSRQADEQTPQRTIAYFLEADARKVWSGIECNEVCQCILDQLEPILQTSSNHSVLINALTESQPEMNMKMVPKVNVLPELSDELADHANKAISVNEMTASPREEKSPESQSQMPLLMQIVADETSESTFKDESDSSSSEESSETPIEGEADLDETYEISPLTTKEESDPANADEFPQLDTKNMVVLENENSPEEEIEDLVVLEITHVKVCQPLKAKTAVTDGMETEAIMVGDLMKRSFPVELPSEMPFDFEITFQLAGARAIEMTKQSFSYHTEVYGHNRDTSKRLTLEPPSVGKLVDGKLTYTCRFSEVTLPDAGFYHLQVIVRLENAPVSPDILEFPFVQVT